MPGAGDAGVVGLAEVPESAEEIDVTGDSVTPSGDQARRGVKVGGGVFVGESEALRAQGDQVRLVSGPIGLQHGGHPVADLDGLAAHSVAKVSVEVDRDSCKPAGLGPRPSGGFSPIEVLGPFA